MRKTDTLYEKIDVIGLLVEEMFLANMINDTKKFNMVHAKASKLCFEAARQMEDMDLDKGE